VKISNSFERKPGVPGLTSSDCLSRQTFFFTGLNPSFEEMDSAVRSLEEVMEGHDSGLELDELMITKRQQLIIAFCWLNLKVPKRRSPAHSFME
jgi:hypothetical protein